jgi:hypothetical protein
MSITLSAFDAMYAADVAHQSKTAGRKPGKLTRKYGDRSVSLAIPTDAAILAPVDICAAAGESECVVTYGTPAGEAKYSKTMTLAPSQSLVRAADLMGEKLAEHEQAPPVIAQRGQNVEANGVHA